MPTDNSRELKRRINSVRSTQKITKVMKLISSAYIKKAAAVLESSDGSLGVVSGMLSRILQNVNHNTSKMIHPLLSSKLGSSQQARLVVIITANRGLCGHYNHAAIKFCDNDLRQMQEQGKDFKIICIGTRGANFMKRKYEKHIVGHYNMITHGRLCDIKKVQELREQVVGMYIDRSISAADVYYTEFSGVTAMEPAVNRLLPLKMKQVMQGETSCDMAVFDSPPELVLDRMLAHYLDAELYNMLAHSCLAEENSRVMAMDNAERNTKTVAEDLQKQLNRGRQASITSTLIDIINSSESL